MKINLTGGKTASPEDIEKLEQVIGMPLQREFLDFTKTHDGAEPAENIFVINDAEGEASIRNFIAVKDIPREMNGMALPTGAYPIAIDPFGNYIIINQSANGAVMFWDHEAEGKLINIASSFPEFLKILESDEIPAVINPDQALESWSHPDCDVIFADYLINKPSDERIG